MSQVESDKSKGPPGAPSPWVVRFAPLVPRGSILDVACGSGRHVRHFLSQGFDVTAVDIDTSAIEDLRLEPNLIIVESDLDNAPWPFEGQTFSAVVVTNYLHRPLLPALIKSVAPGGLLIYETFAQGNERFGKPKSPEFLLKSGELLEAVRGKLNVIAYENIEEQHPRPAMRQRICARR